MSIQFIRDRKFVFGMIHLSPMPGTPFYSEGAYEHIRQQAVNNAIALKQGGVNGCIIQNGSDRVFQNDVVDPLLVASFTDIAKEIKRAVGSDFEVGVNIMRNHMKSSLAVAKITGCSIYRCSVLIGATSTTSGILQSNPFDFLQYRRLINAESVSLIAEIYSDHFKWLGDKDIVSVAKLAQSAGADAVAIGDKDEDLVVELINRVKTSIPNLPVIISGYTNHQNAKKLLKNADGVIVGSCFEPDGKGKGISVESVQEYMKIVENCHL